MLTLRSYFQGKVPKVLMYRLQVRADLLLPPDPLGLFATSTSKKTMLGWIAAHGAILMKILGYSSAPFILEKYVLAAPAASLGDRPQ
jgi:hypothetical protein